MFRHVSLIVISTAVYGLALGWWRSVEMALYVATLISLIGLEVFGWIFRKHKAEIAAAQEGDDKA